MKAVRTLQNSSPHAATAKYTKFVILYNSLCIKSPPTAQPLNASSSLRKQNKNFVPLRGGACSAVLQPRCLCNSCGFAINSAPLRGSRSCERSKGRKAPIIKHIPHLHLFSKNLLDRRGNVCYHRHCTRGSFFAVSTMRLTPTLRRFAPVRSPHCSRLTRQRQQPGRAFSFFGKFHKNTSFNSCSLPMNSPRFF